MDIEVKQLREEVERVGPRSPSRRYPEDLRDRIVVWVRTRRAEGGRAKAIADQVGIPWESLSRWSGERSPTVKKPKLRRVEVLTEIKPSSSAQLVLRCARGFWVEGLDVASLAGLLRNLE